MSIQALPQEVIAQIKSSVAITSLNSVICELFKNSLDAGATRIDLTVDQPKGACIIEDDGDGILPSEFERNGGLGKLYHSSKLHSSAPVHGGRGLFLASLSAMSVLTIVSHHQSHRSHNMITMHKSEVVARHIPAESKHHLASFNHGTKVTVRDLFGNMPVRVKQRALVAEKQKTSTKDWDELRHDIVAVLLAWPEKVAVSIRDSATNQKINLRLSEPSSNGPVDGNISIPFICSILSQSSFILPDEKEAWVPVGASTSKLKISGTISLYPSATKQTQFISLGIQPVKQLEGNNVLHYEVNRLFANSAFGNDEEIEELAEAEKQRRAKDQRYKGDAYTNKELKGVKKGVNRWPMFYIQIHQMASDSRSLGSDAEEILNNESNNLATIVELLQAMVLQFLTSNNFRPKAQRGHRLKRTKTTSPIKQDDSVLDPPATVRGILKKPPASKRSKSSFDQFGSNVKLPSFRSSVSRPDNTFDTWSRGKSGLPIMPMLKEASSEASKIRRPATAPPTGLSSASSPRKSTPDSAIRNSVNFVSKKVNIMQRPFEDVEVPRRRLLHKPPLPDSSSQKLTQLEKNVTKSSADEETMEWINPITKAISFVNKRTGLTVPVTKPTAFVSSMASSRRGLDKPPITKEPSPWISSILKTWTNPTFAPTESTIPQVQFEGPDAASQQLLHGHHHHCTQVDIDRAFKDTATGLSGQISKSALRDAEIVSQVDKKFILVKLAATGSEENNQVLVLIDQHAADERVRIESLMEELCSLPDSISVTVGAGVLTAALVKPLNFEVSSRDTRLLEKHRSHFTQWGIIYRIPSHNSTTRLDSKGHPIQLLAVTHLPPSILERCKLSPRLLIDMIRTEVYKIDQQPSSTTHAPISPQISWLERIHICPQGLIDMLNSRACRSAIMFNDSLEKGQCEMLVRKLGKCMFPFQCAHGRPSLVPLVDLGGLRGMAGLLEEEDGGGFGVEMRRWRESMGRG